MFRAHRTAHSERRSQRTAFLLFGEEGPDAPVFDKVSVLGHAVWLMANSAPHKHLFITDMEWLIMPPVALEQFRIWREKNMPVAKN